MDVDVYCEIFVGIEVSTSVSDSDHGGSIASLSIFSDSETQELPEEECLEENNSEVASNHSDRGGAIVNVEQANLLVGPDDDLVNIPAELEVNQEGLVNLVENERHHEEVASDVDEEQVEENLFEVASDSSVANTSSLLGGSDSESMVDEGDFAIENEEYIEEVASTLDEEQIDVDQSEVASEHSLESVNDPSKYSTEDPSWIEVSSDDSDEDMAEDNDEEVFVDHDVTMNDLVSNPTSDSSAEENVNVPTAVSSSDSSELRRNNEKFLQSAPVASTASDSAPSLTPSEDAEFRIFIQRTRELQARVDVQEVAVDQLEVPEVAPELLDEQVVAAEQPIGFGNVENHLDDIIANGGILPQLPSVQITFNWLNNLQNHF